MEGKRVVTVEKAPMRDPDAVSLPLSQAYSEMIHKVSPKLRVVHWAVIAYRAQSHVIVLTERTGLSVVEPSFKLHDKFNLALAKGVAFLQVQEPSEELVSSFSFHD